MKQITGIVEVTGYNNLDYLTKRFILTQLKKGDTITLLDITDNQYDPYAIAILHEGLHIGWYKMKGNRQRKVYEALSKGVSIKASIESIEVRYGTYVKMYANYQYEE